MFFLQLANMLHPGARVTRLQLFEHALAPMADLPVLEVLGCSHILTDLSLAPAKVVFDYLTEEATPAEVPATPATAT